tara:strand:- start:3354 stop:3785 length:432 start_codon:yes stop_codon:yes gene_type:complete
MKSQRVYCETIHNKHRIKLIGNYQLGADILYVEDAPIYTITLTIPSRIDEIEFFPKSKLEKFFRVGGNKGVKRKYSSNRDTLTAKLILSKRFESLMLSNNVYISTETNDTKSTIILRAVQPVPDLTALEELLEIITIISNKLK